MNKRLMIPLFVMLLMVPFTPRPVALGRLPENVTTISIDGTVTSGFVRDAGGVQLDVDTNIKRGFIEFALSLPGGAVVDKVQIVYRTAAANGNKHNLYKMTVQPSTQPNNAAGNEAIYNDISAQTLYLQSSVLTDNTWYTYNLGAQAVTDINSHISWFSVGFTASGLNTALYSSESANDPYLIVEYHLATDYTFIVGNPVYENNTDAGTVTVHITGDGFDEDHSVSAETTLYFPVMPEAFSWDIGGGASRMVFTPDEENFTVTLPEATDYIYGFTVIDYTGRLGNGTAYLEAWRSIGGVETLVERMPIVQPNAVPLNLVYGRTYHMQVLFADGTRYNWGYYVAAGSFTATIIIRGVEFTDQAQVLYNDIHVEAQRVNATYITVDYLDDRNATVWANVTIRIRGGAVVLSSPQNVSSYTVNWASADPDTGYVVTVSGLHTDYGEWGYSRIFDQPEDFPAAPDLTGIFNLGLGPNLLGWIVTAATVVGFSVRFQARGLLAGAAVASMLTYIGWATFGWDLLVGLWVIAVVVALGGGER